MARTVGQRIKEARKKARLTQTQLGAACGGKTPQAVFFWEHDKTIPSASDLATIAGLTNTTIDFLLSGKGGDAMSPSTPLPGRIVPSVPWQHVIDFIAGNYSSLSSVRSHFDCGLNSFATKVADVANAPAIEPGHSLIVDPDQAPDPGDYVLAKINEQLHVRRYQPRADSVHLAAINPDWPSYTVSDWDSAFVGTVTEIARPRR